MRMLRTIPALPVKNIEKSIHFYCEILEFTLAHHEDGFAAIIFDDVRLHLWVAYDESWRNRNGSEPVISGAESFIAGTASCRIEVVGIEEFYRKCESLGIIHPNGALQNRWWGVRDFGILDPDNNLIEFFENSFTK